ncbi:MAG: hypothetical protein ACI9XO_000367 [Paraglaciecola sp.]|jgi:hypothetical protein
MKQLLLTCFLLSTFSAFGQSLKEIQIAFTPKYNGEDLHLERSYKINETDSLQIETFKCYLSNFKLYDGEKLVYTEPESYHLLNASESEHLNFILEILENIVFSHLQFDLGIDSLTNMAGVMGGDLDPTKGMYWTWQSGYINFKLEGTSNLCDNRNNDFVYHLGGYAHPNNSIQTVSLAVNDNKKIAININIAIASFLGKLDLTTQNHVMSLGEEAIELAQQAIQIFSISDEK